MPCEGSLLAAVERNRLSATRLKAAPRVSSRPSPLSSKTLRRTLLCRVVVAVDIAVAVVAGQQHAGAAAIGDDAVVVDGVAAGAMDQHADAEIADLEAADVDAGGVDQREPGAVVVRTLAPNWPGTAPGHDCAPLSSTTPAPSSTMNSPVLAQAAPVICTGPLIAGSSAAGLIT